MQFHLIDWSIIIVMLAFLVCMSLISKKYVTSVADFLVAGRCAGRYLISLSNGMAGIGVLELILFYELFYKVGFTWQWWAFLLQPVLTICALSGWVLYRYRQTRAMTLAQFFEIRYNKTVRIFAGILAFLAGIINFGIFPAVGARFFIYFTGMPTNILLGIENSTFVLIMMVLLGIALFFTYIGGQVVVIITDFIQGIAFYVVMIVIILVSLRIFNWSQVAEVLALAPENESMVNALSIGGMKHFDIWFYFIDLFGIIYAYNAWQGGGAYHCSAKTPHEAKMGRVLEMVRHHIGWPILFIFLPICAYTFMNHPDFFMLSSGAKDVIGGIENPQIQIQMTTPVAIAHFLPIGLLGCFGAIMLAAFISTNDTLLHSWGSIFIQDVVMPLRKKPLSPQEHIRWLRWSILSVAIFIFFFSLYFKQNQYLIMFNLISNAIFTSGVGAVIIGGLYWKRGTAAGAIASMITGAFLSIIGMIILQIYPDFIFDGARCRFIAMASSLTVYVVVSLVSRRITQAPPFDMDWLLHRGKYAIKEDVVSVSKPTNHRWKKFGMGKEFTLGDKIIYLIVYGWVFGCLAVFVIGAIYNLMYDVTMESWLKFWHVYLVVTFILSVIVLIWLLVGGLIDLRQLFRDLRIRKRDDHDNGRVIKSMERL